jgi:pimeloyl-ACP methyl ester carboxylesterase
VEELAVPTRDGASLAAERAGAAGGPTVVLLHAGVADRRAWHGVAERLAGRGADAVAYDRRGFGGTPGTTTAFRHADDLLDVLAAVAGDGRPAWLVGNSQGGLVALDVALSEPGRVAGLVLVAPAVSGAPEIEDDELDAGTRELSEAIDRAWEAGDLDELNRLEVRLWLDGPAGPDGRVGGAARELALDMNAVALSSGMDEDAGAGDLDAWSRLEEIRAPTTIVFGTLDLPPVIERCRTLAERLPAVREVVELPDAAHLPSLEDPERLADAIARALGVA